MEVVPPVALWLRPSPVRTRALAGLSDSVGRLTEARIQLDVNPPWQLVARVKPRRDSRPDGAFGFRKHELPAFVYNGEIPPVALWLRPSPVRSRALAGLSDSVGRLNEARI